MSEHVWLKWGVLALAVVGSLLLIGLAFDSADLEGQTWSVDELVVDGAMATPIEGTVMTAHFEDGGVAGIASCNNYFGSYTTDGDSIEFGPLGSTLMACPDPIPQQEQAYLGSLEAADRYEIDGKKLTLYQGDTVLVTYAVAEVDD